LALGPSILTVTALTDTYFTSKVIKGACISQWAHNIGSMSVLPFDIKGTNVMCLERSHIPHIQTWAGVVILVENGTPDLWVWGLIPEAGICWSIHTYNKSVS
jgi:hypothetical protein